MKRNNSNNNNYKGGVKLEGILLIVFIILKLTGLISWSWVWVLSPLWISVALALVIVVCYLIGEACLSETKQD